MDALQTIENAFEDFENVIQDLDVKAFRATQLQDVYHAAHVIERDREQGGRMRNLKRIEPLLHTLGKLAKAVGPLCSDKSRVCYLWAPIKLLLQTADQNDACFKQLLSAYFQLARRLPPSDHFALPTAPAGLSDKPLADLCTDLLDFHTQTYLLLRRAGWATIFDASWKGFHVHFECILQRLDHTHRLLDSHARALLLPHVGNTYGDTQVVDNATLVQGNIYSPTIINNIPAESWRVLNQSLTEAIQLRQKLIDDLEKRQKEQSDWRLRESIAWLQLDGHDHAQDNLFSQCADFREEDTCEWILTHAQFANWLDRDHRRKYLWLKGKPGAGKTTLASFIFEKAPFPAESLVAFCACTQHLQSSTSGPCDLVFRILVAQILRKRPDLVAYVYEEFVKKAELPVLRILLPLCRTLLDCIPSTFFIIDGLDECDSETQQVLVKKIGMLVESRKAIAGSDEAVVKVLICSRDTKSTPHLLRKEPVISLNEESDHVTKDIKLYASRHIKDLCDRCTDGEIDEIVAQIAAKANGMFLWVKLVTSTLLDQRSIEDLHASVHRLPAGLKGVYQAILQKIEHASDENTRGYIRSAFTWLTFSRRPLKTWELCDALIFADPTRWLNERTKLRKEVLDNCKPLLEQHHDDTVSFIHFSVKEFLLSNASENYIQPLVGSKLVATTCIRYLLSCEDFFRTHLDSQTYRHIVLGLHNLFPYVHEHWGEHLTTRLNVPNSIGHDDSHSPSVTNDRASLPSSSDSTLILEREDLLMLITSNTQASKFSSSSDSPTRSFSGEGIIDALDTIPAQHVLDEPEMDATEPVLSKIDQAYERFRSAFESLLQNQVSHTVDDLGVTEKDLSDFRRRHTTEAYLCTWKNCPRSVKGFDRPEERQRHVQKHLKRHCCTVHDCELANTSLGSHGALKRHLARYHHVSSAPSDKSIVPKLRLSNSRTNFETNISHARKGSVTLNNERSSDLYVSGGTDNTAARTQEPHSTFKPPIPLIDLPSLPAFLASVSSISPTPDLQSSLVPAGDGNITMRATPIKKKLSLGDYLKLRQKLATSSVDGSILPVLEAVQNDKKQWISHARSGDHAPRPISSGSTQQNKLSPEDANVASAHSTTQDGAPSIILNPNRLDIPVAPNGAQSWDYASSDDPQSPSSSTTLRQGHRRHASTQLTAIEHERRKRNRLHVVVGAKRRRSNTSSENEYPSALSSPLSSPIEQMPSYVDQVTTTTSLVETGKKWRDRTGRTYLARACTNDDLDSAKARFAERPHDLNVEDYAGNTPLQIASLEGFEQVVEFLLSKGADVNVRNIDKDTPLIDAVENGHIEVVKLLLKYGANPRMANGNGDEPFELVASDDENGGEMRELLAKTKDMDAKKISNNSPPAFNSRRKSGRSESVRNDLLWQANTQENLAKLCEKGDVQGVASILSILGKAETESLIAAARAGHEEVLQLLIGLGNTDPDPQPIRGPKILPGFNTPMLAAIGQGCPSIVKLLVNQPGFNPLRKYKDKKYYEIAEDRHGEGWEEEYNILMAAYNRAKGKTSGSPPGLSNADGTKYRRKSTPVGSNVRQRSSALSNDGFSTTKTKVPKHGTGRDLDDSSPAPAADIETSSHRRRLITGREYRNKRIIDDSPSDTENSEVLNAKEEEEQRSNLKRNRVGSTSDHSASNEDLKRRKKLLWKRSK